MKLQITVWVTNISKNQNMETKNSKMFRFLRRKRNAIVVVSVLIVLSIVYLISNGGFSYGKGQATSDLNEQVDDEESAFLNWNGMEEDEEEIKIFGELSEKEVLLYLFCISLILYNN